MTHQPLFHTITVGAAQVTLIQDGELSVPAVELFKDVPTEAWVGRLPDAGGGMVRLAVTVVLVRADDEVILIDSGLGAAQGGGGLLPALAALGLTPDDVTRVVFTHTDGDHVGGAAGMTDGAFQPPFRRARHHIPRGDWDWLHGMTDPESAMYQQALDALPNPTLDAPDARLTPSLRSIDAAGHTPGHRALVVESGGQTFCFVGDLVHFPPLHFAEPDRVTAWDALPDLTPASRRRIAAQAATGDWELAAAHAAFPALGHVTQTSPDSWTWHPTGE